MAKKKELPIDKENKYKLDLFKDVLPAINRKDRDFWDKCSEEEQKSITPIVLQRWLTSVCRGYNSEDSVETGNSLIFINELINKIGLFNIPSSKDRDHRKLQWLMLTIAGNNKPSTRHAWVGFAGQSETPLLDELVMRRYPGIGMQEIKMVKHTISEEELVSLCLDFAMDDGEIKKYKQEFKKYQEKCQK